MKTEIGSRIHFYDDAIGGPLAATIIGLRPDVEQGPDYVDLVAFAPGQIIFREAVGFAGDEAEAERMIEDGSTGAWTVQS